MSERMCDGNNTAPSRVYSVIARRRTGGHTASIGRKFSPHVATKKVRQRRSEWMLRSEAAEIFDVSVRTIQRWVHRWRGRHLRTMMVPRGKQRVMLLHRGDVERLHKTRFGRPPYQIDAEVMAAIVRGESPDVIVRSYHVSLDELERIRERFLRMTQNTILVEALKQARRERADEVVVIRGLTRTRRS